MQAAKAHGFCFEYSFISDEPIEIQYGGLRVFECKHTYVCRRNSLSKYKSIRSKASFDTKHRMFKVEAMLKISKDRIIFIRHV